ncbi:hypothetical protein GYMLUDRAFT_40019 [Collybiopsis luxurians FD-317 M1]|nr:hypothetical protein GYMLUDRAFT_40019 [Collybiopsis luxurians FD-317 M1]
MPSWQSSAKAYLIGIINGITITPVSYYPNDIVDDQSDKVSALLQCLLNEKENAEKPTRPSPHSSLSNAETSS